MQELVLTEAVETCPYCGCDNSFANYDPEKEGYVVPCWNCEKSILLCDECLHADDNPGKMCDWHGIIRAGKTIGGECFRNRRPEC